MTKDSAEGETTSTLRAGRSKLKRFSERIMQTGKKKLVLDHLIVQKMDDDQKDADDVKSILMYGAKALFEEGNGENRDIVCEYILFAQFPLDRLIAFEDSEQDIDQLIEKTEQGGDDQERDASSKSAFSFARIFSAGKDILEEMPDENEPTKNEADSWAQTLAHIAQVQAASQTRAVEISGRGVRRKAAQIKVKSELIAWLHLILMSAMQTSYFEGGSPEKVAVEATAPSPSMSDGEYSLSKSHQNSSDSSGSDSEVPHDDDSTMTTNVPNNMPLSKDLQNSDARTSSNIGTDPVKEQCGLCKRSHLPGSCFMVQSSKNLAEYREILIMESLYESFQTRVRIYIYLVVWLLLMDLALPVRGRERYRCHSCETGRAIPYRRTTVETYCEAPSQTA